MGIPMKRSKNTRPVPKTPAKIGSTMISSAVA
jgi:hypothetical protein